NAFFVNDGQGGFINRTSEALVGDYRGAMGLAAADFDGDLDADLFVTHWVAQENALYSQHVSTDTPAQTAIFFDEADRYGLGHKGLNKVGWATGFFDYNNDGALDLFVVNGHTIPLRDSPTQLEPMRSQLFWQEPKGRGFFHEVGAVDSIVDIVAAQLGFHLLGIEHFVSSPLHVGAGTVKCAHGIMPVPAPATARLLQGKPTHGGEVQGELVTPTGAALIDQRVTLFGPAPLMRTEAIGYGSGTRDLADRANVLRIMIGECDTVDSAQETIQVLEANLDDMSGELLAPLVASLMDGGALDAFLTPVIGKKGRPGHLVTVLAKNESAQALCERLFTHSTTLGVRMRTERRSTLTREWKRVTTPWGSVRIKIGSRGEQTYTTSPEYEDCQCIAASANVPVRRVYEAALSAAVQEAFDHE
ncbi:MAG: DUF111 family protein, partial [Candidatus Hydrogenedentes bacterium]|nr:DUF111 family protein [Candidatus Hydrogenedentota bacterium]